VPPAVGAVRESDALVAELRTPASTALTTHQAPRGLMVTSWEMLTTSPSFTLRFRFWNGCCCNNILIGEPASGRSVVRIVSISPLGEVTLDALVLTTSDHLQDLDLFGRLCDHQADLLNYLAMEGWLPRRVPSSRGPEARLITRALRFGPPVGRQPPQASRRRPCGSGEVPPRCSREPLVGCHHPDAPRLDLPAESD